MEHPADTRKRNFAAEDSSPLSLVKALHQGVYLHADDLGEVADATVPREGQPGVVQPEKDAQGLDGSANTLSASPAHGQLFADPLGQRFAVCSQVLFKGCPTPQKI